MNDNILRVTLNDREIILIGTAHVSRDSIDEVNNIIRGEKPGMVCVELDAGRYKAVSEKDNWESLNVSKLLKEGKGFLLIANLVLSSFQRRLGNDLGVKPGDEMKSAIETSGELGIPFRLCDREVQITLRRAWARCGLWSKCKLLAALLSSAFSTEKLKSEEIENLKQHSELDGMMNELSEYMPAVKETLIDERDEYLAAKIWLAANESVPADNKRTAAVVGAGHLHGIKAHLEKIAGGEKTPDVSRLDIIPPKSAVSHMVSWIIPALIIALIAVGFARADFSTVKEMLLYWVLWNGSLAAAGCVIALGHPLAILVSFLGAPLTSLNPFIGIGILSGIVQAALHKPRVSDAENMPEDITSLKGIYRNRITRTLLVFFLSSLGSSIGTFVSIPTIAALLVK